MGTLVDTVSGFAGIDRVQEGETGRYYVDQRRLLYGNGAGVLLPRSVEDVVRIVRTAAAEGIPLVPQGGNTSYCGGATPDPSGRQLVVSLEKLDRIRGIDPIGLTLSVDAGVILANARAAAEAADLFLPLSLGSEGSCTVGGNIATNAGGLSALRYGVTRDLVLGLEVVLPDGSVLDAMSPLRKNTAGYDLKQIFIGSEGTLGIITGAAFKLYPRPAGRATCWLAVEPSCPLAELLLHVRRVTADLVTSFEFMSPGALALVDAQPPLPIGGKGAILVELHSTTNSIPLDALLSEAIEEPMGRGWISDAALAVSERQRADCWRRRETIPEGEVRFGGSVKHDISVPISAIDLFLGRAAGIVANYDDSLGLSFYGHVGDGNIHYNVLVSPGCERTAFSHRMETQLSPGLYELADELGGTFSAEHGVGRFKSDLLRRFAGSAQLTTMARIRAAIDPEGFLNPGSLNIGAPEKAGGQ